MTVTAEIVLIEEPGILVVEDIDVEVVEVGIAGTQGAVGLLEIDEDGDTIVVPTGRIDFVGPGLAVTLGPAATAQVALDLSEVDVGGELGGTLDAPTVNAEHSGSTHQSIIDTEHAHEIDVVGAHDASAIAFSPTGSIASANAQNAIVEALTDSEAHADAADAAHVAASDPHPQYDSAAEVSTAVASHAAAADPHTGYQKESEKGIASGYASLDSGGTIPDAQIPAAVARDSEVTSAVAAHAAAGDPHPAYETAAEAQALVDVHTADASAAHAASAVVFTPAGTIAATDVQSAIEEVATETGGLPAHLADTSDAHDASAVSVVPFGTIAATDVQAALQEVAAEAGASGHPDLAAHDALGLATDAELATHAAAADPHPVYETAAEAQALVDAHSGDATDAHDASAVSVLDVANQYASTDVEGALAEVLDTEQAHEADSSGAHAASAVAFTPTGTVAATDVQSAIAEVASEAALDSAVIHSAIVDTKGDLIVATAADTVTRLPVGGDGTLLVPDSTLSPGQTYISSPVLRLKAPPYKGVGNDVANDTAAIVAWLAAVADHAAVGLLDAGTFQANIETLFASQPNAGDVVVAGAGKGVSTIHAVGTPGGLGRALFDVAGGKDLELHDLTILGFGDLTADSQAVLGGNTSSLHVARLVLRNVEILNWQALHTSTSGVYLVDIADSILSGVKESPTSVILFGNAHTASKLRLRNVEISAFGQTGSNQYHGIYCEGQVALDLDGVRFTDAVGAQSYCLQHYGPGDPGTGGALTVELRNMVFDPVAATVRGMITAPNTKTHLSDSAFLSGGSIYIQVNGGVLVAERVRFAGNPSDAAVAAYYAGGPSQAHFSECDFEQTSGYSVWVNQNGFRWTFERCRFPSRTMAQAVNLQGDTPPVWIDCEFSDSVGPNTGPLPSASLCGDGTRWYDPARGAFIASSGAWLPLAESGVGIVTNLLPRSQEFDNAIWLKLGSTPPVVTANAATDPNSGSTADAYKQKLSGGSNSIDQTVPGLGAIGGRTFTVSVYVKGTALSDGKNFRLRLDDAIGENLASAGTTVALTTSWQRVSYSYTFGGGNANTGVRLVAFGSGFAVDDDCYLWGGQLEEAASVGGIQVRTGAVAASGAVYEGLVISDVNLYRSAANVWTTDDSLVVAGSLSPSTIVLPAATSPAQTAEGSAVWDSDDDVLTIGDGASRKTFGKLGATSAPAVGAAAAGSSVEASRVDHVHPTGAGTPSTQALGDAAAVGTGPAAAMTDHKHAMPALGTTAAAIGTSAGGSATTPSKSDHVHATGAGTPSTQAFGDAASVGSGPAAAMTDHKHAMPSERAASSSTPAAVGTAAVGTGTTDARSDHVHATGAGTPTTSAFSDAAAVGTGPAAAMTDHKHGRESSPLGLPLALTGAVSAARFVGATTSGAPVSGTFVVGDWIIDQAGQMWVCVVAGTPGTWIQPQPADPMHLPAYHGFKAWNGDPMYNGASNTPSTQQVLVAKIFCPVGFTAASINMIINTAGASLTAASATTVAAGSNGQNVNALTASTLNVAATAGFSAVNPSYIRVATTSPAGTAILKYTGTSGGNAFTGITTISGTGTVSTGNAVNQSYNQMALYSTDGTTATMLGFTADQFDTWTATGLKVGTLTVVQGQSLVVAAGSYVYVFYLSTGTTPIQPKGFAQATINAISANAGLSGATFMFGLATAGGAANTLPDQYTLSGLVTNASNHWFALK